MAGKTYSENTALTERTSHNYLSKIKHLYQVISKNGSYLKNSKLTKIVNTCWNYEQLLIQLCESHTIAGQTGNPYSVTCVQFEISGRVGDEFIIS